MDDLNPQLRLADSIDKLRQIQLSGLEKTNRHVLLLYVIAFTCMVQNIFFMLELQDERDQRELEVRQLLKLAKTGFAKVLDGVDGDFKP